VGTDDDRLTLVQQRRFRALVTCTTCGAVVMGPAADYEPAAAFAVGRQLGAIDRAAHLFGSPLVHEHCGGALHVTVEEIR
jgi:hypothetical protein